MPTPILLLLAALAMYLIACAVWPYTTCSKCGGAGRFRSPSGKAWRPCPRCKGRASKVRLGRRVFTALTRR